MLLHFFVVDAEGQIRRVSRDAMEQVWQGLSDVDSLGHDLGDEFRLISVLCDDETLQPEMCFFAWMQLRDGEITDESRFAAYDAMTQHQKRRYASAAANRQLAGWPENWQHQMAVALDVPASHLRRVGVGGPLLMSDLWGLSIEKVVQYFEDACDR